MWLIRLFAIPVALVLLAAQCVPTMWQMHCEDTGRTTTHWGVAKSCCMHEEPENDAPTVGKLCCTFSKVQATLDSQHRTSSVQVPTVFTLTGISIQPALTLAYAAEVVVHPLHGPPPRGATLDGLAQLGVLRL